MKWEAAQLAIEKARSVSAGLGGVGFAGSSAERVFFYEPMDYFAKEFYDWKDDIVISESQILKVL